MQQSFAILWTMAWKIAGYMLDISLMLNKLDLSKFNIMLQVTSLLWKSMRTHSRLKTLINIFNLKDWMKNMEYFLCYRRNLTSKIIILDLILDTIHPIKDLKAREVELLFLDQPLTNLFVTAKLITIIIKLVQSYPKSLLNISIIRLKNPPPSKQRFIQMKAWLNGM